jgi:Na+/H+-translocating membrane pyrophosphatase
MWSRVFEQQFDLLTFVDASHPYPPKTKGGISEMAELDSYVREKTDALDAAGNTTAAIGKVSHSLLSLLEHLPSCWFG